MRNLYTAALSYNGYTITDGALRLIVLLYAADLGYVKRVRRACSKHEAPYIDSAACTPLCTASSHTQPLEGNMVSLLMCYQSSLRRADLCVQRCLSLFFCCRFNAIEIAFMFSAYEVCWCGTSALVGCSPAVWVLAYKPPPREPPTTPG